MEKWDRFSTNKPSFLFPPLSDGSSINPLCDRKPQPCNFRLLLPKERSYWSAGVTERRARARVRPSGVYCILHARPSQGHTSNSRPVSHLVAGLNCRTGFMAFSLFFYHPKHTHTPHRYIQKLSITAERFVCLFNIWIPPACLLLSVKAVCCLFSFTG